MGGAVLTGTNGETARNVWARRCERRWLLKRRPKMKQVFSAEEADAWGRKVKAAVYKRLTTGAVRYGEAKIKYLTIERSNLAQDIDGVTSYDITFIDQPGVTGQIKRFTMWIDDETCEIVATKHYA